MPKPLFMLSDEELGGAQNICRIQSQYLKKHGVDARIVNLRQWQSPLKRGLLHKAISVINMARGVRRLAQNNPGAIFYSAQHHGGVACFLAGIPCHTRLANDMRRFFNIFTWLILSRALLWHPSSQIYFLDKTLLDDCPALSKKARKRSRVLGNPAPDHQLLPLTYAGANGDIDALFIGRFHMSKNPVGFLRLIEAADFPFNRLRVFGDGPHASKFKETFHESPVYQKYEIEFRGWQMNPWVLIDRPSVVFLTSHFEGSSGILLEAFASGIVVISTVPSPATRHMLSRDRGLDLAEMDDATAGREIHKLLNDPRKLDLYRMNARKFIEKKREVDYGEYLYGNLIGNMG